MRHRPGTSLGLGRAHRSPERPAAVVRGVPATTPRPARSSVVGMTNVQCHNASTEDTKYVKGTQCEAQRYIQTRGEKGQ